MSPISPPAVFLSHSHKDHSAAYAVTEWIFCLFPDVQIFVSHKGLKSREQIEKYSYLTAVSMNHAFVCLLTEHSMTSNAVFDELDVARQLSKPIIQVMQPNVTDDDRRVYSYLEELWVPKYGPAIHTNTPEGEQEFLRALCHAFQIDATDRWEAGMLMRLANKERGPPPEGSENLTNVEASMAGRGSREDTIEWLKHLELEHDNSVRARGMPTIDLYEPMPIEARVARLLLAMPNEQLDETIKQLRSLINDRVVGYVQGIVIDTNDWKLGARAQKLLAKLHSQVCIKSTRA